MDTEIKPRPEKLRVKPVRSHTGQLMWVCRGHGLHGWGYDPAWALRTWKMRKAGQLPKNVNARYDLAMHEFDRLNKIAQTDDIDIKVVPKQVRYA